MGAASCEVAPFLAAGIDINLLRSIQTHYFMRFLLEYVR